MPISFKCSCGKNLSVKEEYAGRKVRCPACTSIQAVPVPKPPEPEVEPLDTLEEVPPESFRVQELPEVRPVRRSEKFADKPLSFRDRDRDRDRERYDDEDDDDRDRRRKRRKKKEVPSTFSTASASIGGGVLMILIAVVWFCGGLMFDIIFFYPPILLVLGIVAIVKGAMNRE